MLLPTPTRNVVRGERLGDIPHTMLSWPKGRLTESYVESFVNAADRRATVPLPRYLPVPEAAVAATIDELNAVVGGIPSGMRAITVRVDIEAAIEGWAQSGNFVDVLLVTPSPQEQGAQDARVIADNIRILSAGRSATPLDNGSTASAPATVTLLTTQEQALSIKAASAVGRITFALRGSNDTSPSSTTTITARASLKLPSGGTASYRGSAKGPDGRRYVLLDNTRWIERESQPTEAP